MDLSNMSIDDKLTLMLAHGYAGLQKAAQLRAQQKQASAAVRALIPQTIDTLIDGDYILKEARAEATEKFKDPAFCLKFIKKMAENSIPRDRVNAYEFGAPVKKAENNFNYSYSSSEPKRSEMIWFEGDF